MIILLLACASNDSDTDKTIGTDAAPPEACHLDSSTVDKDADDTIDLLCAYAYEDQLLVLLQCDDAEDGEVKEQATYKYDAMGREIYETYDSRASEWTVASTYYEGGNLETETGWALTYMIESSWFYRYGYTADDVLETEERDNDGDGVVDWDCGWTYAEDGMSATMACDKDADGDPDHAQVHSFDSAGNEVLIEADDEIDGIIDWRFTSTYADGLLVTLEYDYDATDDDPADTRYTYTYDAGRKLSVQDHDVSADGAIDDRTVYSYVCDL